MGIELFIGAASVMAGTVALNLVQGEIDARLPRFHAFLLKLSVKRLPEDKRERCHEEWSRHLEDTPGPISKMLCVLGFFRASYAVHPLKLHGSFGLARVRSMITRWRLTSAREAVEHIETFADIARADVRGVEWTITSECMGEPAGPGVFETIKEGKRRYLRRVPELGLPEEKNDSDSSKA